MSEDWSRMSNPAAAHSLGGQHFDHWSTTRSFLQTSWPSTWPSTMYMRYGGDRETYRNTASRPRQCPGCGAWKTEERHHRLVCAYCGNPA